MGNYITTVAVNIAVFSLFALSLNIIIGYAGQSMMGHAAFFGIGAYTAAIMTNTGVNFWLTLPVAMLVTGALGAGWRLPGCWLRTRSSSCWMNPAPVSPISSLTRSQS